MTHRWAVSVEKHTHLQCSRFIDGMSKISYALLLPFAELPLLGGPSGTLCLPLREYCPSQPRFDHPVESALALSITQAPSDWTIALAAKLERYSYRLVQT